MFNVVGTPEPSILSATDILIGDMSDINYEFLLLNRPIVLLSNGWLSNNFPDMGHRINSISQLQNILKRINIKDEYTNQRKKLLLNTFNILDNTNAAQTLEKILSCSQIDSPLLCIHHLNNVVYKSNLSPLVRSAREIGVEVTENRKSTESRSIHIAAHFLALSDSVLHDNYCVHLDHGLKGKGTANVEMSKTDYLNNNFFPNINLHITAGRMGQDRTIMLLGPLHQRAVVAGYPKADDILNMNTIENRQDVCDKYDLDPSLPIVTYAPAGELSLEKPGGSLSKKIIRDLKFIEANTEVNVIVKLKYPHYFIRRSLSRIKRIFVRKKYT